MNNNTKNANLLMFRSLAIECNSYSWFGATNLFDYLRLKVYKELIDPILNRRIRVWNSISSIFISNNKASFQSFRGRFPMFNVVVDNLF